jgi:hypothetical protein
VRQLDSRLFFRLLTLAVATGCATLLVAGCTGSAVTPTAAQLLASAAAALRSGAPCTIHGDVVVGPAGSVYDSVSSVSAGDHFSATITQHVAGNEPGMPENLIDDGSALYFQSAAALQLAYNGQAPASLAGRWVRFPSWPGLSGKAFNAEYSALSQLPGPGGAALTQLMLDSTTVIYQGASCVLLLAQMRTNQDVTSSVVPGELDGRPVLTFTMDHVFVSLSAVQYRITVSSGAQVRLLRVTSGSDVLSLGYPATIAPISAPGPADVISAPQIAGLSGGR